MSADAFQWPPVHKSGDASASRIVVNAHRVNHGEMPELTTSPDVPTDFYSVEIDTPEEGLPRIIQIVMAVRGSRLVRRWSKLGERLAARAH